MKQVLQDVRSGEIAVHELPEPASNPGHVLVAVRHSLISAGTERAMAALGSKSLLQKARARPDDARENIGAARTNNPIAPSRLANPLCTENRPCSTCSERTRGFWLS